MSTTTPPARLARWVAVAAASVLLMTGCAAASGPADTEASANFPVTLEHNYGETTITEKPERVITIGWNAQDVVAALGVVPVATTDFTWGTVDKYLPWFADKVNELGGELPEILTTNDAGEYDYEQILSLRPDVILAPHSGVTEEEYQRLSEIAPTVAYTGVAWAAAWQDVTRTVGAALGQPDEAEALIASTDASIAEHAAAHPEFAGKTFVYGWSWVEGDTEVGLYTNGDAREQLIEQLGFSTAPAIAAASATADQFVTYTSLENLDTVQADLYILWANSADEFDAMKANPLIAKWAPIAGSKYYVMDEQELAWASSQPSVLSIPWSLDVIVPELAAVIAAQ